MSPKRQILLLFLARRYVWKQKHKNLVYKLSRLACYSIAAGTAILLLVLFSFRGMKSYLNDLFYQNSPILKIEPTCGKTFLMPQGLRAQLEALPQVQTIIEVLEDVCLVQNHTNQVYTTIKGVSDNFHQDPSFAAYRPIQPAFVQQKQEPYPAIIDQQLMKNLSIPSQPGKFLKIYYPTPHHAHIPLVPPYRKINIQIVDYFNTHAKHQEQIILVPIGCLEQLTDKKNRRSRLEITLNHNDHDLKPIQNTIAKYLPESLTITNRDADNNNRNKAIAIEHLSVYMIFALVLFLSFLHLLLMLYMLVLEKQDHIKTLCALGMEPAHIGRLFFYSGLLITIEGTVYGTILSYLISRMQQKWALITLYRWQHATIPYPLELSGTDFVCTILINMALALLISIPPAILAQKLTRKSPTSL